MFANRKSFDGGKPSSFSRHHALLCSCSGVQGCLKVPIDLDFICRRMGRTLPRRADNFGPQIAVPDFGERLVDFIKFWFCKVLGFCKVAWGEFGNLGISNDSRYWAILSRTPKCGVAFLPWEKEGDMKHQRQSYKNTLVSKIHLRACLQIYGVLSANLAGCCCTLAPHCRQAINNSSRPFGFDMLSDTQGVEV